MRKNWYLVAPTVRQAKNAQNMWPFLATAQIVTAPEQLQGLHGVYVVAIQPEDCNTEVMEHVKMLKETGNAVLIGWC